LHSLVDFNLYVPANAMLLAWIAGLTEALRHVESPEPRRSRRRRPVSSYVEAAVVSAR
jgi:hypothetical protein